MSLMSELLSARRWTVDRSRGVNAPFACLAPDSNPVPGVRLTIAAIAVAKKKHHKSLIDAATHITYIVCSRLILGNYNLLNANSRYLQRLFSKKHE